MTICMLSIMLMAVILGGSWARPSICTLRRWTQQPGRSLLQAPIKNACSGYCGAKSPAGCFCDAPCAQYGDCCPDLDSTCNAGTDRCTDVFQAQEGPPSLRPDNVTCDPTGKSPRFVAKSMYRSFTVTVNTLCKPPTSVIAMNSSNCKLTLVTTRGPSCECNMWQVSAPGLGCCPTEFCPPNSAKTPGYLTETYLATCTLPAPKQATVAIGIRGHVWGPQCTSITSPLTTSLLPPTGPVTSCTACPPGMYRHPRAVACMPCNVGTYSPSPGAAAACPPCPPGTFAEVLYSTACTACPVGTASAVEGGVTAGVCEPCPPGQVALAAGSANCTACPPGTAYRPASPATPYPTCSPCPPGTYNNNPSAQSYCTLCPPGTYSGALRATSSDTCTACPDSAKYTGSSGATKVGECKASPPRPSLIKLDYNQDGVLECLQVNSSSWVGSSGGPTRAPAAAAAFLGRTTSSSSSSSSAFCGFSSAAELAKRQEYLWRLVPVPGYMNKYTIHLGTGPSEKCLIFPPSPQDLTPTLSIWTSGPLSGPDKTTLCGWGSAQALVDNAQAVWELAPIPGASGDKFMLKNSMKRGSTECLLVQTADGKPYRGLYSGAVAVAGSTYCGFLSAAGLLAGGVGPSRATVRKNVVSAVWTVVPLPPV